jgi:hypothetical protein
MYNLLYRGVSQGTPLSILFTCTCFARDLSFSLSEFSHVDLTRKQTITYHTRLFSYYKEANAMNEAFGELEGRAREHNESEK